MARPTTAKHLCALHFSVDAVAAVAFFLPAAAVRKLQPGAVAALSYAYELLTSGASSPEWTDAAVAVNLIHTSSTIGTRGGLAFVNIDATVRSGEPRGALAAEPVDAIHANAPIVTRVRVAVVYVLLACGAFPALLADAGEGVPASHAGPSVQARAGGARVVLGHVASVSGPAWWTRTAESVPMVVAGASIVAGCSVTLTLTRMTGLALPAVGALAVEVVHQVHAAAAIFTRVVSTLIHVEVAQSPLPAVRTHTLERVDAVDARAAILTRVTHAVIDILMTVDAAEALVADTAEVPGGVAHAAPARPAHVGRNVPHQGGVVGCHGNGTAVDHLTGGSLAVVLHSGAGLALVAFGTGAVEVLSHTVARGGVLTGAGIT